MKRYISEVLISAIMLQLLYGCSSYSYMTKDEFIEGYFHNNKKPALEILTTDFTLYKLEHKSYTLITDTILAKGLAINNKGESEQFEGKIPLDNIYTIQKNAPNYFLIPVIVVIFSAAVAGVFYLGWGLSGNPKFF